MEDFYETRISEVNGQMVAFFGVFDGMVPLLIAYWYNVALGAVFYTNYEYNKLMVCFFIWKFNLSDTFH